MTQNAPDPGPTDALAGLRVLDFSIMIAGPYCARLLADLGADVVKIEPLDGDDMRQRGTHIGGKSTFFGALNAGKRSLALDLKTPAAIALVRKLAAASDVIVENFRPGAMAKLGLDDASLRALNPRLIYCSISGYGQTGPSAGRSAYAPIVHAESGFDLANMAYQGLDAPPHGAIFTADILGGAYGFAAIQTALYQRERTGLGQHIDVALMDCMMNLLVHEVQEAQAPPGPLRSTFGPVGTRDRAITVTPITQKNFLALCTVMERPALAQDARFARPAVRSRNWAALMREVADWAHGRTARECLDALEAAGVPSALYRSVRETLQDPQLAARGVFTLVDDGAASFRGANPPFKMSRAAAYLRGAPPQLGADSETVAAEAKIQLDEFGPLDRIGESAS